MPRLSARVPLLVLLLGGCRAAVPPWGASLETARRNIDNTFAAFAFRFYNVQRDARFTVARARMGRFALTPSRIFGDTAVWTVMSPDSIRALYLHGTLTDKGYSFTSRSSAAYPERLGDQRHFMQLTRMGDDTFEWITQVEHGVGPVRAAEVGAAFGAIFTAFEGRTSATIRSDIAEHFPRTARHMRQLWTITSLRVTPSADGSSLMTMRVTFTPDSLRRRYAAFAAYLDKYLMPSHGLFLVTDRTGAPYLDLRLKDGGFDVRLRAKEGALVALSGAPTPLPDSLSVRLDFSAKMSIFRVGYSNLLGDLTIERGPRLRGWMFRFRREPDWHFPLGTEHLISTPLRRPFEGRGTELRLGVRDDLGRQAMSVRQVRTAVQESAIMRWLGGLGATAFGDFAGTSELDENRFLTEFFGSMRLDVAAMR